MTPGDIIHQTNEYRASKGLAPLQEDPNLQQAASAAAKDMEEKGYFSHVTPDGKDFRAFVSASTTYKGLGQNLARNYSDATSTMNAWKASPTHETNLSSHVFTHTGVAVVPGKNMVLQYFGYPDPKKSTVTKSPLQPKDTILATDKKAPINFSSINVKP